MKTSKIFKECFDSGTGHAELTCKCGRHHFDCYNEYDSDWETKLEKLLEKSKIEPDKFIKHEHAIGSIYINGCEIVMDCECDIAQNYETFLIQSSSQIAKYLMATIKAKEN